MATKTDNHFDNWQEYEYRSQVHGGTGWYWQRSDGLRLSMQTSGRYYPVGVGPRNGHGPRTRHWEELEPGSNPAGGWGGWEDPVSLHEHVLCDMQTEDRGEHVRFVINSVLLATVGESEDKGRYSELQVLQSGAGYYVGTVYNNPEGYQEPGSRDSGYFATLEEATGYLREIEENYAPTRLTP